ncbi:prepilin peptidase [Glaciibacter sp. 2TAF33]|uniref:prepilin peptidase n=1 Tax=Glaciibacter sp. 2TAF33 TaxID=3233015 RepID=UPI003F919E1C
MTGSGNNARTAVPPSREATHRFRSRFLGQWTAQQRRGLGARTGVGGLVGVTAAVLLLLFAWLRLGWDPALVPAGYLAVVTAPLIAIDAAEHRLPNRLVLPGYAFALAGVALSGAAGGIPLEALVAGAAYFIFLLLMNLAGGMGMGDVKLAGVLGLALGVISAAAAVAGVMVAFLLGAVAGAAALLARGSGPRTRIPFGPFLLAGYWASVALAPLITPAFATWTS